jgi:hypothetical protein
MSTNASRSIRTPPPTLRTRSKAPIRIPMQNLNPPIRPFEHEIQMPVAIHIMQQHALDRTQPRISPRRHQQTIRRPKKTFAAPPAAAPLEVAPPNPDWIMRSVCPSPFKSAATIGPCRSATSFPPDVSVFRCCRLSASAAKDSPHPRPAHPGTRYRATARPSHSGSPAHSSPESQTSPAAVPVRTYHRRSHAQDTPCPRQPRPTPTPGRYVHHGRSPPPQLPRQRSKPSALSKTPIAPVHQDMGGRSRSCRAVVGID